MLPTQEYFPHFTPKAVESDKVGLKTGQTSPFKIFFMSGILLQGWNADWHQI